MTRLQAVARILIVAIIVTLAIVFALWRRGTVSILVDNNLKYCVAIDDKDCDEFTGPKKIKAKIGKHQIKIQRKGYVDFVQEITVSKAIETEVKPEFIFAPILTKEPWKPIFNLPDAILTDSLEDDQWLKLSKDCNPESKNTLGTGNIILDNLPNLTESLTWHQNGLWAIGKITDQDKSRYFIYDAQSKNTRKLDGRIKDATPLYLTDEFAFIWREPISASGAEIFISNYSGDKLTKITDLPDVDNGFIYLSHDRAKILFQNTTIGQSRDFYLIDIATGRREKITSTNNATTAFWAPDSKKILLAQHQIDQEIKWSIFSLDNASLIDLNITTNFKDIAWSNDSAKLFFIDVKTQNLSTFDLAKNEQKNLAEIGGIIEQVKYMCAMEKELMILGKDDTIFKVKFAE